MHNLKAFRYRSEDRPFRRDSFCRQLLGAILSGHCIYQFSRVLELLNQLDSKNLLDRWFYFYLRNNIPVNTRCITKSLTSLTNRQGIIILQLILMGRSG